MPKKSNRSIFETKTFWLNALSIAAVYGEILPPKYAAVPLIANMGLRMITEGKVTFLPQKKSD